MYSFNLHFLHFLFLLSLIVWKHHSYLCICLLALLSKAVLETSSFVSVRERRVKEAKSERKDVLWLNDCMRNPWYNLWLSHLVVAELLCVSSTKSVLSGLEDTFNLIYFIGWVTCYLRRRDGVHVSSPAWIFLPAESVGLSQFPGRAKVFWWW